MSILKKSILLKLSILLLSHNVYILPVSAESHDDNSPTDDPSVLEFGAFAASGVYTVNELMNQSRFVNPGGHGFAAEEANNLIDSITHKAEVVGYDNALNGADRKIIGRNGTVIYIQDKYYSTAAHSVDACFDSNTGLFRYLDADGNPMQIEVPADQYIEAVAKMREKIKAGKVPGITDEADAESIVRKGHLTYKQAVNLTKAGTIESLTYDAAKGTITAATAFGIGTTLDFALRLHNGEQWQSALKNSALSGLKTGVSAFAISVISSQLSKTKVITVFKPGAEALVKTFGDDFTNALLKACGTNAVGQTTSTAVKLLQSQALVQTVTVIVLTAPDVVDLIKERMSAEQLLMNLATATAGVVGSTVGTVAGSAAGGAIVPGAGNAVGGIAGGLAGGVAFAYGANAIMHVFYVDDAEKMLDIIQDVFYKLSIEYLVTEEEATAIADELPDLLQGDTLKDMFASDDHEQFAEDLMRPLFEKKLQERQKINMPTNEEMRRTLINELKGVVFIH